jgi:carboxymethylenebutenolidase
VLETGRLQYGVASSYISIIAEDQTIPAYWAYPQLAGVFPSLVVLHGEKGLSPQVRMWVRRFAEQGYYVIAPNLLSGTEEENIDPRTAILANGLARLRPAIEALRTHSSTQGQVGLLGWRAGGEIAFEALHMEAVRTAVIVGARLDEFIHHAGENDMPFLAIYGDSDDQVIPSQLYNFSQAIAHSPASEKLLILPGVGNDFMDANAPGYHEVYTNKVWGIALDFLSHYLPPPRRKRDTHQDLTAQL